MALRIQFGGTPSMLTAVGKFSEVRTPSNIRNSLQRDIKVDLHNLQDPTPQAVDYYFKYIMDQLFPKIDGIKLYDL